MADLSCISWFALSYFLIGLLGCFGLEWCLTRTYFYHEDPKAPNINFIGVGTAPENLRGYVNGSPTIGCRPLILLFHLFGEPEINEFHMAVILFGKDYVFGLEIPIYYSVIV